MDTTEITTCGGVSILTALLPTLLFLASEALPYISEKHKCNGILQTVVCAITHLINKEPCSTEEIADAIARFTPTNSPINSPTNIRVETNNIEAGQTPHNSPVPDEQV